MRIGPDHPSGGARFAELPPSDGPTNDYRLLANELMWLMLKQQLFTFVTAAPVETPRGEVQPLAGRCRTGSRRSRSRGFDLKINKLLDRAEDREARADQNDEELEDVFEQIAELERHEEAIRRKMLNP